MAFGVDSKIFSAFITDQMNATSGIDLNANTIKIALFNNTGTPSQTAASGSTAYNTGAWATANEVSDTTEWPATGQALGSVTSVFSTNVYTFDAANEVSDGTSATLADVRGCLIYSDTVTTPVADQGICYLSFGGANAVTDGTFTVQFHANGIFTLTL